MRVISTYGQFYKDLVLMAVIAFKVMLLNKII